MDPGHIRNANDHRTFTAFVVNVYSELSIANCNDYIDKEEHYAGEELYWTDGCGPEPFDPLLQNPLR